MYKRMYPCCVVDPKYPADDVFFQVGRDELHLDVSVAMDSIFRPVLWAQLNKTGRYRHTHEQTHTSADTSTKQTQEIHRKDDSLASESNSLDVHVVTV